MTFNRAIFALAFATCAPAFAQATFDQNKALAGGTLPGDAPGFPITINQPGSYKLMSNLVVPAGSDGIVIQASDVTLDLNGFTVMGSQTCTWAADTLSCSGGSNVVASGVLTPGDQKRVTVRNGRVSGFSGYGIYLNDGMASELTASANHTGMRLGSVRGNHLTITLSSFTALDLSDAQVDQVLVHHNRGTGIHGASAGAPYRSRVSNAMVWNNAMLVNSYGVFGVALRNSSIWQTYTGKHVVASTSLGGNLQENTAF